MNVKILNSILNRLEDFFFPPLCILCDKPRLVENRWFCIECEDHLVGNFKNRNRCPRCSQNRDLRNCTCELVWDYPFESIFSLLDYDDTVQGIMRHVKYGGKKKLAYYTGSLFSSSLPDSLLENADIVTAIPLHWARRKKRGYNQAEWLARGLFCGLRKREGEGENLPQRHGEQSEGNELAEEKLQTRIAPLFDILYRKRRTRTQVKLDRTDRQKNVSGAFAVVEEKKSVIKDKTIILVDDVITTGATTSACTEALLEAGCRSVRVVSLARD